MLDKRCENLLADKVLALGPSATSVTLREKGVMEVSVPGVPSEVIAVNIGKIGRFSGMREGEWVKICDYLIIGTTGGNAIAILVELKKTLSDDNKRTGMEQLRRSLPILEYLYSVFRIQFEEPDRRRNVAVRYCLIGERYSSRVDKQPVRARLSMPPEKYKDIVVNTFVGSRIPFDLLQKG